jgi:hypothetical protein
VFSRRERSARLFLVAIDESGNHLDDLSLLLARELSNLFEDLLDLADRSGPLGEGLTVRVGEELIDAYAEDAGELPEDIGARGFVAPFPEGDVGLRNADGPRELGLTEGCTLTESHEQRALLGTGASG